MTIVFIKNKYTQKVSRAIILALLLFFLPVSVQAAFSAPFQNYGYCQKWTMAAGGNSGGVATTTTTGFALWATSTMSVLAATSSGGHIQKYNYASSTPVDVIFTDGTDCNTNAGSAITHTWDSYSSTTGEFAVAVKAPNISSTTAKTVLIYYGYSADSSHEDDRNTFGSLGEAGVWPFGTSTTNWGRLRTWDRSPNDYNGTLVNFPGAQSSTLGQIGGGINFDGTNDYILGRSAGIVSGTSNYSIGVWVNPSTTTIVSTGGVAIYSERGSSGNDILKLVMEDNVFANKWQFITRNDANTLNRVGSLSNIAMGWTYLTVTVSGSSVSLYINGVRDNTGTASTGSYTNTLQTRIGSDVADGAAYFPGVIDDVRVYNRTLSPMDVLTLYNNTKSSAVFWTFGAEETPTTFPTSFANYGYCQKWTMTAGGASGGVATTTTTGFALVATSTIAELKTTTFGGRVQLYNTASSTPIDVAVVNGADCYGAGSLVDFYFESYASTTGAFTLWVEPPTVSSTTAKTLLIYYGNPSGTNLQNKTGVWGSLREQAVYNLSENPAGTAPQIDDSTSSNFDGTARGSMTTSDQVSGQVNGSLNFDGVNDYIELPTTLLNNTYTALSVCGWIYLNTLGTSNGDDSGILAKATSGSDPGVLLFYDYDVTSGTDQVYVFNAGPASTGGNRVNGTTKAVALRWQYVCGVMSGTGRRLYVDGDLNASVSSGAASVAMGTDEPRLGSWDSSSNMSMDGKLDDVRVYNQALTAMDILTIYNNTKSSAIFWSFGSEQTSTGSSGPVITRPRLFISSGKLIITKGKLIIP